MTLTRFLNFSIFTTSKLRDNEGATTAAKRLSKYPIPPHDHHQFNRRTNFWTFRQDRSTLGISVSNLEESVKWYTENLGFEPVKRLDLPEVQFRVAILEYQGFGVELIEVKGSTKNPLAWNEPGPQHRIQGIVHFAFRVNDLERDRESLSRQGARFACEPTVLEGLGIRYFHIFDNDGNLIEFGQSL